MVMVMVSTTVCMFVGFDDEINILYPYEINVQTGYSEVKENVSEQSSDIIQFIEDTGTNETDSEFCDDVGVRFSYDWAESDKCKPVKFDAG